MSGADSSTGPLSEHRELLIAGAAGVVIFLVLAVLFGAGGAVGLVGVLLYTVLWLAVGLFVLWLFYRLVVAVERIAHAQQRIAAAQNPPGGTRASNDGVVDGDEANDETDDGADDETNAA